jgi:hypothetical protein
MIPDKPDQANRRREELTEPVTFRSELWPRLGLGEMWLTFSPPGWPQPALKPLDPNWKNPLALLDEPRPKRVRRLRQRRRRPEAATP